MTPYPLSEQERKKHIERLLTTHTIAGPNGCRDWTGCKSESGYGYARCPVRGRPTTAHKILFELHHGLLLDYLEDEDVAHYVCDRPTCVAIQHLRLQSHAQNQGDMAARGRAAKGQDHGQSVLSDATRAEIRELYAAGNVSQRELARQFGCSQGTISYTVRSPSQTVHIANVANVMDGEARPLRASPLGEGGPSVAPKQPTILEQLRAFVDRLQALENVRVVVERDCNCRSTFSFDTLKQLGTELRAIADGLSAHVSAQELH